MLWFSMLGGMIAGLIVGQSFIGGVLGVLIALVIRQAMSLNDLTRENENLQQTLTDLAIRFDVDAEATHERLLRLERMRHTAQPEQQPPPPPETAVAETHPAPLDTPGTMTAAAAAMGLPITGRIVTLPERDAPPPPSSAETPAPDLTTPAPAVTIVTPLLPEHETDQVARAEEADPGGITLEASLAKPAGIAAEAATESATETTANTAPPSSSAATQAPHSPPAPRPQTPPPVRLPWETEEPATPSLFERGFEAAKAWLFGGNTVLRIGVVLLFIGLAFLLRYASERVVVPIELRYAGVTLAAIALLGVGWWVRGRNAAYGLILQGTGVAVLYLTIFAAMRLHPLISPEAAFTLLVVVTVCSAILAVLQNAMGLAAVAVLGGFAAPILTASGSGNHVALFSYFALLNAGIFAIAWFKAWRPLNLIGFIGTFGIGFAWGLRAYHPGLFATTEPFLLLFFFMYVGIGLLFARRKLRDAESAPQERTALLRWSAQQADYIDGTVLFGPPLVGFGLQCAVIGHIEFGMAFSAIALGLFYLVLARALHSHSSASRTTLLVEICLALGVIFGTLAIPLALDARWTSAAWAVEGAGIYWLGLKQHRRLARIFALLLQAGAALAYLSSLSSFSGLSSGQVSLLQGSPLGALMLGGALLFSFFQLRRADQHDLADAEEAMLPLLAGAGLTFLYLIAPLSFGANATAMSWACAGALTLFAGLRLGAHSFILCAFVIQLLGSLLFLINLRGGYSASGQTALLLGSPLGALILGGALLLSFFQLRRADRNALAEAEEAMLPLLAGAGLTFLYLIAPLFFGVNATAISWAFAGVATLFAGLRLGERSFLLCAFAIQLLGGILFLLNLQGGDGGQGGVLASGWRGLLTASLIGLALINGVLLAARDPLVRKNHALLTGINIILLLGLIFINLAVLFVLPWQTASAVWAGSGVLILWLSLVLRQRLSFYFGIALQLIGGSAFLLASPSLFSALSSAALDHTGLRPLAHSGFWTPAVLALAALVGAWRLRRGSKHEAQLASALIGLPQLSQLLLLWGTGWWAFTALCEVTRFVPPSLREHALLGVASLSILLWTGLARREQWREMALLCLLLIPLGGLSLLHTWQMDAPPSAELGWLVWPLLIVVYLLALRALADLLPARLLSAAHVLGCWLVLGVLALEMRALFMLLAEQHNAWRWLGWALVPSAFLLLMASSRRLPWPVMPFSREYRLYAALPVAFILFAWFWLANLFSSGAADPLPYLPVLNPLELGLLIAVLALYRWHAHSLLLRDEDSEAYRLPRQALIGAALFALLTMTVCRSAYHYFGVPFRFDALFDSMFVQAALSLLWTLCALGLTVAGTRTRRRDLWMVGASLVGVVVVKLFFIELSNSGSLERIISFIGVGVLLLVVGYFSPLPPRQEEAPLSEAQP